MIVPIYLLGKYLSYALWCYLGLRWLRDQKSLAAVAGGLGFGTVRLGLGMLFGLGIFIVVGKMHLNSPAPWWMYFAIYAPVRYIEWSILAAMLGTSRGQVFSIRGPATQKWIVGGIVISHLADLPIILFVGEGTRAFFPVGRFLC